MIKQTIYIEKYGWLIHAYYHQSKYDVDSIMEKLWDLGCDSETAKKAYQNLTSGTLNNGLCYSNYRNRESVFVIAKTSSAEEFANSWHHELSHLQAHIAKVFGLDPLGEPIAYMTGEIAMEMFPKIQHFMCNDCRKHFKDNSYEEAW